MKAERVYLIGFMGAGKTTAGRKVASLMGWNFIDLDDIVEELYGNTIPYIFREEGEQKFRELEVEALKKISLEKNYVIAAGGGTPCFHDNMEYMLANGLVVYLKMTPGQLASRLLAASGRERPLLKDVGKEELLTTIAGKLDEREMWYGKADLIVDGMNISYTHVASSIRNLLVSE